MKKQTINIARIAFSLAFWIGLWAFASFIYHKPRIFPSPKAVFLTFCDLLKTSEFYLSTLKSIGNILFGVVIAILLAAFIAVMTHFSRFVRALVFPFLAVVKATPVASFIIIAWLLIGAGKVPTFITVLIVLPVVWTNLDQGLQSIDKKLSEVASVYRFSIGKKIKLLVFPSVFPYFFSSLKSSLGLAWKAGIAAEIIAMPSGTIGMQIANAKQYSESCQVFAWTFTVILLSILIELGVGCLFKRFVPNVYGKGENK